MATFADWRAAVDKELKGADFAKALVAQTPEGIAIQPLYTETTVDPGMPGAAPFVRGSSATPRPFRIVMRLDHIVDAPAELAAGADAVWLEDDDDELVATADGAERRSIDPISRVARGALAAERFADELVAHRLTSEPEFGPGLVASSLPAHDAGADAADELAYLLAAGVAYLRALDGWGVSIARAAGVIGVRVAIGRDTFGEICKLRALRRCWSKLLAAAGAPGAPLPVIHAVCSARTAAQRDPWVNMLRGTTQVFAAAIGGAEWITPLPFDAALVDEPSSLAARVARNTALVLREESQLGRVIDPAGGSYYVETRTDQLARAAWDRFSRIERAGGVLALLASGAFRERFATEFDARQAAIAKRKEPVLGVSEFANPEEQLPAPIPPPHAPPAAPALVPHRDAERFEALRLRVEAAKPDVALVTLGPPAEHRARVGFAANVFTVAGIRVREGAGGAIAVLCGSDERYAAEAEAAAAAARAAGAKKVVLAGRAQIAGVDANIYLGCDVLAVLTELLV